MSEHEVVIAGGGPTGLMLGAELALAGIDVMIVERRASQDLTGSRAGGLHSRTIEVLDQRGIADRFLSAGRWRRSPGSPGSAWISATFRRGTRTASRCGNARSSGSSTAGSTSSAVPIRYGREVTGFAEDDAGVDVQLADGEVLRAAYLVGCDGGRSLVRKTAGIDFPGSDPTTSNLIAEAELAEEPSEWGIHRDAIGIHALSRSEDGRGVGILMTEQHVGATTEPTLRDLSEAMIAVYGTDYGIHDPTSISRFTDATRQAATYRSRRVLLAGDAAHVHPPDGGQGLQLGVQDAVNLGWKLAQVVNGASPDGLLDTYHAERHPVAARVLRTTMASVALRREDEPTMALRNTTSELLTLDEPRRLLAGMMSGLDIHYDKGEGHPLLGRRMPDLDLVSADGPVRVFTLLHDARPVLVELDELGGADVGPWADRVRRSPRGTPGRGSFR